MKAATMVLSAILTLLMGTAMTIAADEDRLREAVTFYASFDEAVEADFTSGDRLPHTRFNHPTEKGKFVFEKGINKDVFQVSKGKGVSGGALHATDVLPRNGRIFFSGEGSLPFKKDGWEGAVSFWINTDPNKLLKTSFCDPIQITHRGAHNGAIWVDFNDARPRDMRMGVFPALVPGEEPVKESDPSAPLIRIPGVGFKEGEWHHLVISWTGLDTVKKDAHVTLYIDGKRTGELRDRELGMKWDLSQTGIYLAVSLIGMLDEVAVFKRSLSAEEVELLRQKPGVLEGLKKR